MPVDSFTSTGSHTWTKPDGVSEVDVLIVAGGGGGGGRHGAGGGAGGLIYRENYSISGDISLTVGSGGSGGSGSGNSGTKGNDSSFDGLTAIGGGAGHGADDSSGNQDGGSGGGTNSYSANTIGQALQPSSSSGGFGNNGGDTTYGANSPYNHAGGGGAGQVGGDGTTSTPGSGGDGKYYGDIFGDEYGENGYFAGGGGGGSHPNTPSSFSNSGGSGGGGDGGQTPYDNNTDSGGGGDDGEDGLANTGGGGGGGSTDSGDGGGGGDGGSGIVLIRYDEPSTFKLRTSVTLNGESIDATVYEDIDDTGSVDNSQTLSLSDGTNTQTLSGFTDGSNNVYWVEFNLSTSDTSSSPVVESASIYPPDAAVPPSNLSVLSVNDSDTTISWDSVSGASSYSVYRAESSGVTTNDTEVTSVDSGTTSYTDSGLENGEKYYYAVTSNNSTQPYSNDTVIFNYDAKELSASDGNTVSSITTPVNGITASTASGMDSPVYESSGLGGEPSLDFTNGNGNLAFDTSVWDGSTEAEVWWVAEMTTSTGVQVDGAPFVWMSDSNPHFTWSDNNHYTAFFRTGRDSYDATGTGITSPHVLRLTSKSGGNVTVEINGTEVHNVSTGSFDTSASNHGPCLGVSSGRTGTAFGRASEVLLRNSISSGQTKTDILNYFQNKWNI